MSYLLDALRRAERERHTDRPIDLQPSIVVHTSPSRRSRRLRWRWIISVALGLLIGFTIWNLTSQKKSEVVEAAMPAEPAAQTAPQKPEEISNYSAEHLDDLLDHRAEPITEPVAPVVAPALVASAPIKPAAPVKNIPAKLLAVESAPVEPAEPTMAEQALSQPADELPAELKPLKEMPPEYRGNFPPLRVDVHAYDTQPARRFVIINGKKYREGEALAEGPSLVSIEEEGVVLRYNNQEILFPIGR